MDSWSEMESPLSLFDFFLFFFFFFLSGPSSGPVSRRFRLLGPGTGEDDLWEQRNMSSNTILLGKLLVFYLLLFFGVEMVVTRSFELTVVS